MNQRPSTSSKGNQPQGYRVWHFALAVPALAVTLQVMLGSLAPLPKEHNPYTQRYVSSYIHDYSDYRNYSDYLYHESHENALPQIEILPLNLRGEMTGPLLASVIKDYFPETTAAEAIDLRDTLPPGDNPRMIVILPKDKNDKPVF